MLLLCCTKQNRPNLIHIWDVFTLQQQIVLKEELKRIWNTPNHSKSVIVREKICCCIVLSFGIKVFKNTTCISYQCHGNSMIIITIFKKTKQT